jgi:outer membrane immunogenic protein
MKTTLAAAAALLATTVAGSAADLAFKAPVAPAAVWNWTGFYIGGHVGAGWGTNETTLTSVSGTGGSGVVNFPVAQVSKSGFLGGGQVGYNWQTGLAVFGVQADIAGLDVKGTAPCFIGYLSCTSKSDWLATVSGRLGAAVADRALIYVKGGAAWLHTDHTLTVPSFGGVSGPFGGTGSISGETTALGWLLGFGAEYAFTPNWTAFIEYDYMDFDTKNAAFNLSGLSGGATAATANADIKNKLSIAKVGVNYKF